MKTVPPLNSETDKGGNQGAPTDPEEILRLYDWMYLFDWRPPIPS